jgi:predicted PurR-regulated permease PerM
MSWWLYLFDSTIMKTMITSLVEKAKELNPKFFSWIDNLFHALQAPYKASAQAIEQLEEKLLKTKRDDAPATQESYWKFWITWLLVVFIWFVLFKWLTLIYLIMTAFIVSMALETIINFFERMPGISRWFAIGLSYLLLIIFLLATVVIVFPFIFSQIIELISAVLMRVAERRNMIQNQWLDSLIMNSRIPTQVKERMLAWLYTEWESVWDMIQSAIVSNVDRLVSLWTASIKDAGNFVVTAITAFFGVTMQLFFVVILSIFFSLEKKQVIHFIAQVSGHVERTELILMKLYRKLGFWLKWQVILSTCIGFFVLIGLNIIPIFGIDIPHKFTLAIIAWLVEFLPYLWPFLWMLPAILIATSLYWFKWLVVIVILYTIIQQIENNMLVPMVMSQTLWMSPLLIFMCLFLWAAFFWFLGILLAVPIAVIVSILYDTYRKI